MDFSVNDRSILFDFLLLLLLGLNSTKLQSAHKKKRCTINVSVRKAWTFTLIFKKLKSKGRVVSLTL